MSDKVIAGFELVEKLGEGGSGSVYKARQISLDRPVALKILSAQWASNEADIERFKLEARAAAKLMHPSIVQVYEAGEYEGIYFFAMQFINGYSVSDWLNRSGLLSEKDTLLVAESIAQGLEYAWRKAQIIHCDIKPDNILIDEDGTVKVADLGLIKMVGADSADKAETEDMLTPNYCSPEQALDHEMDCRTDVYSLGAMMYHMATGKMPFGEFEGIEPMEKHINGYLEDPRKHVRELSEPLCQLIRKMMAKDRNFRQKDWPEVLEDIQLAQSGSSPGKALDGSTDSTLKYFRDPAKSATGQIVLKKQPTASRKSSPAAARRSPPPKKKKKSPAGAIFAILILLGALGGGGYMLFKMKNGGDEAPPQKSYAELLAEAQDYARNHPNDYDGAIQRYNLAATSAATTEERAAPMEALSRLTQARMNAVQLTMDGLKA
ncbi:MAG: serine/threonine-protein kinase, partial [Verrucomicrobiota bacterium]